MKKQKKRLIQMGEYESNIFTIGSPDLDIMNSKIFTNFRICKRLLSN